MKPTMKSILMLFGLVTLCLSLTACPPSYPKCHNDEHCQTDGRTEWCVESMCKQCRDDSHCSKNNPCMQCGLDRTCSKKPKCCLSDAECPGEKCWKDDANPTLPGECGDLCLRVVCPAGQKCVGGSCIPDKVCVDDAGCPPNHKCIEGNCIKQDACAPQTIYFDFNESAIRLDQEALVKANADCMKQSGGSYIVEGHCDQRGDSEYNLALGQRRANGVIRQYRQLGVEKGKMSALSKGKEDPSCGTFSEGCFQKNRRVETRPTP